MPSAVRSEAPRQAVIPIAGFQRSTSEWQLTVAATAFVGRARSSSASASRMLRSSAAPSRRVQPRASSAGEAAADPLRVDRREGLVRAPSTVTARSAHAEPRELGRGRLDVEVAGNPGADAEHRRAAQRGGGGRRAHRAGEQRRRRRRRAGEAVTVANGRRRRGRARSRASPPRPATS